MSPPDIRLAVKHHDEQRKWNLRDSDNYKDILFLNEIMARLKVKSRKTMCDLAEEERKFETVINLKILGYLLGAGKNEKRPKIAIRENAVEVRIPRERVIFGDMKDWE